MCAAMQAKRKVVLFQTGPKKSHFFDGRKKKSARKMNKGRWGEREKKRINNNKKK